MSEPEPSGWRRAGRALAPAALLFLFGLATSLYYGRRGYMPLDQSICFDGGWRILCGQVPFRDYHAPNGFTVHALQAVVFALGGVGWLSYCLHAAVVNGLFAVLVRWLLVRMGLAPAAAWIWGALSALVLYPPFGVPYMDQHAFFFSFAAVALAVDARRAEDAGRARTGSWLALPAVLLLAGLSKQIPSAFALPIVLVVALVDRRALALPRLAWLALSSALLLGALALAGWLAGVDLERVDTYFLALPAEEGARRHALVPDLGALVEHMRHTAQVLGLRTVPLVHAAAALALAALGLALAHGGRTRARLLRPLGAAALAEALLVVCLLFVALTSNQPEIGVPYVFVAAGLVQLALERARDGLLGARRVWLAGLARVLGLGLVLVGLADGWHFARTVDATRRVNDIEWSPEAAALNAPRVHPELAFMRWQLPPSVAYGPANLRDLVEFLRARAEPFLLISDASIVYGLAGQPSAAPSMWFQHGLTLPRAKPDPDDPAAILHDPRMAEYEALLLERLERLDCRFVVLEHPHTWAYTSLEWFPRLAALVEARRAGSARFGSFEVIALRPPPAQAGAKSP